MIAAIRARFPNTPASQVWSDAVFHNWLNSAIQFSLAHFWSKTSFGQVDLRYQLFPPIVLDDPRANMKPEERQIWGKDREYLVNGVTAKISAESKPDWGAFDALLIWFAQPTDLFGGGSYPVPLGYIGGGGGLLEWLFGEPKPEHKYLPVAVCDILSTFDLICQELGHVFGFEHPLDKAGNDYGDPYDSMASRTYGGKASAFQRPSDPALPVGFVVNGVDQQQVVGPLVSAAQIYTSAVGQKLMNSGLFVEVPASYLTAASSFKLYALDYAVDRWPGQVLPIVAVLPPSLPNGDTHFLELRRSVGYDSGLRKPGGDSNNPPIGVVIHRLDRVRKRVVYVDTLPLVDHRGDRDYHLFGGGAFTFRVTSIGQDFQSVGIIVGGGDFWRNFGINIEESHDNLLNESVGPWQKADVSPCFLFPPGEYFFRFKFSKYSHVIIVSSYGYELPGYVWKINNAALDRNAKSINVTTTVEIPKPEGGNQTISKTVSIECAIGANSLSLTCDPHAGNFSVLVEVTAGETSPEVMKNFYEERNLVTSVSFRNVLLEWDDNYKQRLADCEAAIDRVNRKRIPQPKLPIPGPEPDPFVLPSIAEVINILADKNPVLANALVNEVSNILNVKKIDILKKL